MKSSKIITILFIVFVLILSSCTLQNIANNSQADSTPEIQQYSEDISLAESRFFLEIPEPVTEDLVFEIIDDVTGIELNPTRYSLQKIDDTHYGVIIPLKIGSIVKYRYFRNGNLPIYETDAENNVIDYRAAYIDSARDFADVLTNWADRQYAYAYGHLEGQIINSISNSPLQNLLVIAAGKHAFTDSDGYFSINNLPPGKHNMVALSTDGEYATYQQEAIIGEGLTTPAKLAVEPAKFVNITFLVKIPEVDTNLPLRILGNTYQLGNVFGNVFNGESTVASRAPALNLLPDGTYSLTLSLPVGFNLVYKYSFGNGFWNAELSDSDQFFTRNIIIPDSDSLITDVVSAFQAKSTTPLIINVTVPENLPVSDVVSIQFSAFGWSSPIPMMKIGKNIFTYSLYGPLNLMDTIKFRFCRNDSCSPIESSLISTNEENEFTHQIMNSSQTVDVKLDSGLEWTINKVPSEIVAPQINNRGSQFITGIEFSSDYSIFDPIYSKLAYQSIKDISANSVVIPVTWTLQSLNPVELGQIAGKNPLWKDIYSLVNKAQAEGLNVILSPRVDLSSAALDQLLQGNYSNEWEAKLLEAYSREMKYTADLAEFMHLQGIIFSQSIMGNNASKLPSGFVNQDIQNQIFSSINTRFSGDIFYEFSIGDSLPDIDFLRQFDGAIVDANWDISSYGSDTSSLEQAAAEIFNLKLSDLAKAFEKPVIIRLAYPSLNGVEKGCIQTDLLCTEFMDLSQMNTQEQQLIGYNLPLQSQIYQAILSQINDLEWVGGIVSSGYNLQLGLQDGSSSIREKPASDVLWYWFPRLNGTIQ